MSPDTQQRILRAAPIYLSTQEVDETLVLDEQNQYRPYDLFSPLLVLLFDQERQTLTSLTAEHWSKWISVFFAYCSGRNGSRHEPYKMILALAYSKAPKPFVVALKRHVETHINNDSQRSIIWHLGTAWCAEIKNVFLELLQRQPLKASAAQDILQLLVSKEEREGETMVASFFQGQDPQFSCSVYLPVAGTVLLTNFPSTWGVRILETFASQPTLGRAIVPRLLRGGQQPVDWLSKIPPKQLTQFWDWLSQQYRGDPYERDDGDGTVTIEHDIYHFRNGVFQTVTQSGKPEACDAMVELIARRPDQFWLGDVLAEMRKTTHRKAWVRPAPSRLMQSFAASEKRIIRTAGELHRTVLESLSRFDAELRGAPPSTELWNETGQGKKKLWQPKDEMNLSNCLKRFLERDLKERGIIADREVQIRPRLGSDPAQLVDILVRAIPLMITVSLLLQLPWWSK